MTLNDLEPLKEGFWWIFDPGQPANSNC